MFGHRNRIRKVLCQLVGISKTRRAIASRCHYRLSGVEPLELRRVLDCSSLIDYAGPCMAGDANLNGQFNQTDVVQVLQAGKFLTGQPASWAEGDWTGDGVFDRLFQIDSRLLSISRWGIKAHDLDDPTTVTQQSRFGETEQSSCGV